MVYASLGIRNSLSFYIVISFSLTVSFLLFANDKNYEDMPKADNIIPNVLDLETAQRIALRENPSLKAVEHRIEQARQRVKQALANYYPQLMANYSATHLEFSDAKVESVKDSVWRQNSQMLGQSVSRGIPSDIGTANIDSILSGIPWDTIISNWVSSYLATKEVPEYQNTYVLNFILRYTLFDGFARKYSLKLAELSEISMEESKKEATRLLLYAVANNYYAVHLAEENIRIAEADKSFNERLLYEAKAKYEKGSGSLSDVLNFEVRLRSSESQIINARQNREIAKIALAEIMGLTTGKLPENVILAPLPEDDIVKSVDDLKEDELLSVALSNRPDLKIAGLSVSQAEARLRQAKSTFYPQIGVTLSHSANREEDSEFREEDFSTTIGLDVTYNLFAGGKYRAMRAEARSLIKEAEENYSSVRLTVISEVYTALQEVRSAMEQLKLQKETAEYVKRNRDLVEKEYNAGQAPLVRLNEAQRDLVEAESRLATARVGLSRAIYKLKTVTSQSISDFEVQK
ncbi:MAG: TolC family protein [Candidatus Hydrogenedentes bacterium]|nr:TolC family protein [Candidatus Hydrogenedentota bacterium]